MTLCTMMVENTAKDSGAKYLGLWLLSFCQNERSWPKSLLIILYFFFGQLLSFWQNERSQRPNISHLSKLKRGIGSEDDSGADLQVFICKGTRNDRIGGIAWVGTVCNSEFPLSNIGLNEKQRNVLSTSEVRRYT